MHGITSDEQLNENRVLDKLDRLERMLARITITGPAEANDGRPVHARVLTKHAIRREQGLTGLHRDRGTGFSSGGGETNSKDEG